MPLLASDNKICTQNMFMNTSSLNWEWLFHYGASLSVLYCKWKAVRVIKLGPLPTKTNYFYVITLLLLLLLFFHNSHYFLNYSYSFTCLWSVKHAYNVNSLRKRPLSVLFWRQFLEHTGGRKKGRGGRKERVYDFSRHVFLATY